jgi:predicted GNAT family acetyltransferase
VTAAEPAAEPAISVDDDAEHGRYVIRVDGEVAGHVVYRPFDGGLDLVHTEIDDRFEGRGLGGKLAKGVLDDVRRRGLLMTPTCPFLASYVERHPEYEDLRAP